MFDLVVRGIFLGKHVLKGLYKSTLIPQINPFECQSPHETFKNSNNIYNSCFATHFLLQMKS